MSQSELLAQIESLKKQLEKQTLDKPKITFKVSPKGAVSVYGLQRFPVTLYKSQWKIILDNQQALQTFIKDNEQTLKDKDE